jgi:hypothetical protein
MREIFVYLAIAIGSLSMMGYAVHMLIGGLVSIEVEYFLITVTCVIISGVMGYMVRDIIQRRSENK